MEILIFSRCRAILGVGEKEILLRIYLKISSQLSTNKSSNFTDITAPHKRPIQQIEFQK